MARTTHWPHHAWRHRPHGHEPAPDPLDRRDPRRRRRAARQRRPADARPDPGRPQPRQAGGPRPRARRRARHHRPRRRAGRPGRRDLLRRRHHPDARHRSSARPSPRGKSVYCEKPTADNLADALELARLRQAGRHQERRRAGQAVPARAAQAQDGDRQRRARPPALRARRVRLLGVRGRPAAGPAPELELQEGRGRRHHPRYALPLALRARQPVRRRPQRSPASAPPTSRPASTRRASPTRPMPTTPPMPPSSSRAA